VVIDSITGDRRNGFIRDSFCFHCFQLLFIRHTPSCAALGRFGPRKRKKLQLRLTTGVARGVRRGGETGGFRSPPMTWAVSSA